MRVSSITKLPFPDLDLLFVEGAAFHMGDESGDLWIACGPVHPVRVSSFYMAKYPVTQRLYQAVMGSNPSYFKGGLRPVESVSWDDAQAFIQALNHQLAISEGLTCPKGSFRLPTEAEWEYAARGGNKGEGFACAGSHQLKEVGWYDENSYDETKAVGLKLPNELGLYDMSGNVWEWCEDDWHDNYDQAPADGSAWVDAPERGGSRVYRGGSYFDYPGSCRAAYRNSWLPGRRDYLIGFRLVVPYQSVG